jgi:hypothetical protein
LEESVRGTQGEIPDLLSGSRLAKQVFLTVWADDQA